jgi:hypothetical protein
VKRPKRVVTRSGRLVYEVTGWSVVFTKGTKFFALQQNGVADRSFFRRKRDALALRRELAQHDLPWTTVRRVKVRMETVR